MLRERSTIKPWPLRLGNVPRHGDFQARAHAEIGAVAQQAFGLADVGKGMPHVTLAKVAVNRRGEFHASVERHDFLAQQLVKGVQACLLAKRHVVDLIRRFRMRTQPCQHIGLHHVVDIAEVARGFAVAIDETRLIAADGFGPIGNHRRIRPIGVLAGAEHVEIAQSDALQAIDPAEYVCVEFVEIFGHRIGRQRLADEVFDLGQARVIAIGGAGRRINEATHARVARGDQHVQKTRGVDRVRCQRVFNRARHRSQSRLMQHDVDALTSPLASLRIDNVTLDEGVPLPGLFANEAPHFIQIGLMAG